MGMAASQARFLQLTSRKTNIEYQGQQINQQRLALANSSSGLFEKMLSLAPAVPPSSQDDKYYTQGYTFEDESDGIQKKIYWQTYDDAIADGAPPASSYYSPASGLTIRSAVDGSNVSFLAAEIAHPTDAQKQSILDALGIKTNASVSVTPTTPPSPTTYDAMHTITSAADFISKISADLSGDFIVDTDLDFSSINLTNSAITGTFQGSLDGNDKTLSNLNINNSVGSAMGFGLFEDLNGASISDLNISNSSITSGTSNYYIGFLAGNSDSTTNIQNCNVLNSSITAGNGSYYIGGLVGLNSGTIENSSAQNVAINVNNSSYIIGGLVGNLDGGTITQSSSQNVTINGNSLNNIGGLVGTTSGVSSISESLATGNINITNGSSYIGGFIGNLSNGTINDSYTTVSLNLGTGGPTKGGFVGLIDNGGIVSDSYASSSLTAGTLTIGAFSGTLDNGTATNTTFYDTSKNSYSAYYNLLSGASATVGLSLADFSAHNAPINALDTSIWDTSGLYPVLLNNATAPSSPTASADDGDIAFGSRQEIRYATIEYTKYTPDGQLQQEKRQEIMVLEFDNLNRLLKATSLTDKNYIDATSGASAANKPFVIGDGDKLTYSGQFDNIAYQDDMNKYEFNKASYDYQLERINQALKEIQSQDKSLELKMKQLDTEHNAVQTEMDAVQKVVQKNVESTFKTFA